MAESRGVGEWKGIYLWWEHMFERKGRAKQRDLGKSHVPAVRGELLAPLWKLVP